VLQIVQFIMTVNANPPTAATMSISTFAATNAETVPAVDLSAGPEDLTPLISAIVPAKVGAIVTAADAAAHLQASFAALTTPIPGGFAALNSAANPTLGMRLSVAPNLIGNGFDVKGIAASIDGSTWTITGTLTLTGSLQATGTGMGATPPADMTITGAVASATEISASADFTINNIPRQAALLLEKAVAPATTGKLALAADPGVTTATQAQHIAANMTILADGQVTAQFVEGEITGLPLCPVLGGRFAVLSGVITGMGNVIAIGGLPGSSETALTRSATAPSSVVFLTGTANADGTVSATVKSSDITGGGLKIPALTFVAATNPMVGLFTGTHTDSGSNIPGTVAFGVNNDGSVHGYDRFMFAVGKRFPEKDDLMDGTVNADGVLGVPVGFAAGALNAIIPPVDPVALGLVMTNDDGDTAPVFPGVYGGTINMAAGTASGTITTGPVIATESFSVTLMP
jgi:hypothetical protein